MRHSIFLMNQKSPHAFVTYGDLCVYSVLYCRIFLI